MKRLIWAFHLFFPTHLATLIFIRMSDFHFWIAFCFQLPHLGTLNMKSHVSSSKNICPTDIWSLQKETWPSTGNQMTTLYIFRPNDCWPNVYRSHVCLPNVCRPNAYRSKVSWPNAYWPNVCRPNAYWSQVCLPNAYRPNICHLHVFWLNVCWQKVCQPNAYRLNISYQKLYFEKNSEM